MNNIKYIGYALTYNINSKLFNDIKNAHKNGANIVEIYLRNPSSTSIKQILNVNKDIPNINKYLNNNNMKLVTHSSYMLNGFCNYPADSHRIKWAQDILYDDLNKTLKMDGIGSMIHFCSPQKSITRKKAIKNMLDNITEVFHRLNSNSIKVILETGINKLGTSFKELLTISEFIRKNKILKDKIGYCIDTAHVFLSGYPIHKPDGMKKYLNEFVKVVKGVSNISLINLNDSTYPFTKMKDIHAPIRKGYIFDIKKGGSNKSLEILLEFAKNNKIPIIMETHLKTNANIKKEIKLIKDFLKNKKNMQFKNYQNGGMNNKNKNIITLLDELADFYKIIGNEIKYNTYKKAVYIISRYPNEIKNAYELKDYKGIGKSIMSKIYEIIKTDNLKILNDFKKNKKLIAKQNIMKIHGIGSKIANRILKHDYTIKNINSLRKSFSKGKIDLTNEQYIGLKYFEELQKPITRKQIEKLISKLKTFKELENYNITIAGSYYMNKPLSNDIDLIFVPNSKSKISSLTNIINSLKKRNIIIDDFSQGTKKYMGIVNLPNGNKAHIDIHLVEPENYNAHLLYFGSGIEFSKYLRKLAKNKGYKLSEYGLKKINKNNTNKKIIKSEKDIFHVLGIEYIPPNLR